MDLSAQWFLTAEDGTIVYTADGTDNSYWSLFRFQPLKADTYTDDYRFSPVDTITPYIYRADENLETYTYYAGTAVALMGATKL